jgi:hypothetical protein
MHYPHGADFSPSHRDFPYGGVDSQATAEAHRQSQSSFLSAQSSETTQVSQGTQTGSQIDHEVGEEYDVAEESDPDDQQQYADSVHDSDDSGMDDDGAGDSDSEFDGPQDDLAPFVWNGPAPRDTGSKLSMRYPRKRDVR